MGVIFDLDQTLVDSAAIEHLRKGRRWPEVYSLVPTLKVYEGVLDLLAWLRSHEIPVCIVTASPRPYYERVVKHHGLLVANSVCYHDTVRKKPHADPILAALKHLNLPPDQVCAVGDDPKDAAAAVAARVHAIGVTWGLSSPHSLSTAGCDVILTTVAELRDYLAMRLCL